MKDKLIKYNIYPIKTSNSFLFKDKITFFLNLIKCSVCGKIFFMKNVNGNLRERCLCYFCNSTNRQRQIAFSVLNKINLSKNKIFGSLSSVPDLGDFVIYNTESNGPVHNELSKNKNYICSEYFGNNYKSGESVNGVLNEDLMNLSFESESINLIISSDVFEHIPDPYKAHEEVYRVLKKGGSHVFTVPFSQGGFLDEKFAEIINNEIVYYKEPVYHGDPIRSEGVLVYNIFSLEMLTKLEKIGFKTNMYLINKPTSGIIGDNAIVFEAIKE